MNPMKATILNVIECNLKDAKVALEYYTSARGLVVEQFVLVNNDMPANMRGPFFVAGAPEFGKFVLFSKEVAEVHAAKMCFEVKHVKVMLEEAIARNEKLAALVNQ